MADNDDQRNRREFVPPPWERDQFDELARRKAEQDLDRLVETIGVPTKSATPEQGSGTGTSEAAETATGAAAEPGAAEAKTTPGVSSGEFPLSDAELQVMLYGLKADEPDAVRGVSLVSLIVAGFMAVGGALILGYGMFALSTSMNAGPSAAVGAATVIVVGGLFIAAGAWLAARGLRQRGER